MSDFDSLREDIAGVAESFAQYALAGKRYSVATATEIDKLWTDQAELRDDLLAVANRVEALTAFVTSNPAEVAAAIVNDANRATVHALHGGSLQLSGEKGDPIDCVPCRGSGSTPTGEKCEICDGYGKVRHA